MNWDRFYETLEADPGLLAEADTAERLEGRLREIGTIEDRLEEEAMRCDRLLDLADSVRGEAASG